MSSSLRATRRTIEVLDLAAQGHPDQPGPGKRRALESDTDTSGSAGTEAVGKSRPGVGLVDDERNAGAPGCNVTGNVVGCAPETVEIGAAVSAVFAAAEDPASGQKYLIPQWELAAG